MLVNVTVKDVSPLITYAGPGGGTGLWGDVNTVASDTCHTLYLNGSFHGTDMYQATATLNFNGTGVWIYGAKRQNHGLYTVTLDSSTTQYDGFGWSGFYAANCSASDFQEPLFGQAGLTQGPHTVIVTNAQDGGWWVDIDYIIFETDISSASGNVSAIGLDDAAPQFVYGPHSTDWATNRSNIQDYTSDSVHMALDAGSVATITFEGDAISIYGAVDTSYGQYTAALDSGKGKQLNGTSNYFYPDALLYHANSLGAGKHQVALSNGDASFDIDYAIVWSAVPVSEWPGSPPASHSSISGGAIAGIAIGAAALVAALACIFFVCRRRRQLEQRAAKHESFNVWDGDAVVLPTPYADASPTSQTPLNMLSPPPAMSLAHPAGQPYSEPISSNAYRTVSSNSSGGGGRPVTVIREGDGGHIGGWQPGDDEDDEEEAQEVEVLPPDYGQATESWARLAPPTNSQAPAPVASSSTYPPSSASSSSAPVLPSSPATSLPVERPKNPPGPRSPKGSRRRQ